MIINDIDKVSSDELIADEISILAIVEELNDSLALHHNPTKDALLYFELAFLLAIQEELIKRGL